MTFVIRGKDDSTLATWMQEQGAISLLRRLRDRDLLAHRVRSDDGKTVPGLPARRCHGDLTLLTDLSWLTSVMLLAADTEIWMPIVAGLGHRNSLISKPTNFFRCGFRTSEGYRSRIAAFAPHRR